MAINFPASPSVNDTFTAGSITYKWDGAKWIGLGVTPADRLVEGSNSLEIQSNILNWSGGNTFKFDYNDTGLSQILKGFDTAHNSANRGSTFRIGFSDGSFGGIEFENRVGSNAAYNSQATHIIRHDGGVAGDVKALSVMPWGDIGINQTSPTSQSGKVLHISGDTGGQARIHLSTSASGHGVDEGHYIVSQGSESGATAGQLAFINMENRNITFTTGSAGANATRLTIQHDGNLNIADGNLIVAAGHGIDFSAATPDGGSSSTSDSEVLDDYEEGDWVPLAFNGTNGASTNSTVGREARYVKIGRLVHISCYIQIAKGSNTTQSYEIYGLPFTPASSQGLHSGISVGYIESWTTQVSMPQATVQPNSTRILIRAIEGTSATASTTINANDLAASTEIILGGTYYTLD